MTRKEMLKKVKRIVVKVGSSVLTTESGYLSGSKVRMLAQSLITVEKKYGKEVILVSSGAIASGMDVLGMKRRPHGLSALQAAAAVGQGRLMHTYEHAFSRLGYRTAQILLTLDGLHNRTYYLNARNTINALLHLGTIPIVNENDTVATEEIRFGDNDTLSAQVALLSNADLLIILSNVDGFCASDDKGCPVIHTVQTIDVTLRKHIREIKRGRTVGGMSAKLETGFTLMKLGLPLIIANGNKKDILDDILSGKERGTLFIPQAKKQGSKKGWLAFTANLPTAGSITVDKGAYDALVERGKSLLATGITAVHGEFRFGDAIKILNHAGQEFAKGITNFSHAEVARIKGKKSAEIKALLGAVRYDEVIHCDNMIILE